MIKKAAHLVNTAAPPGAATLERGYDKAQGDQITRDLQSSPLRPAESQGDGERPVWT